MPNILITGGSGFLGGHLLTTLNESCPNHKVFFTYNNHSPDESSPWSTQGVQMDVTDQESVDRVFEEITPSIVVHTLVKQAGFCEENPEEGEKVIVGGTEGLVKAYLKNRGDEQGMFVAIGSDLVFDGDHPPYAYDSEASPVTKYGEFKRQAELIIRQAHQGNKEVFNLRCALIYGFPGSFAEWMYNSLTNKDSISLFTDEYRTPIYVQDICDAIVTLMDQDHSDFPHTFNLGGPDQVSRIRFCHSLALACGMDADGLVGKCVNDEYGNEEWEAGSVVTPVKIDELKLGYQRARDVSMVSEEIEQFGVKRTSLEDALKQIADKIIKE